MSRHIKLLLLIIMLSPIISGCWDMKEIDDLSLVTGFGIHKEGDMYAIVVQLINPIETKEISSKSPITIYEEEGRTVFEAIRKLSTKLSRQSYESHLKLLLISENVAEEGLSNIIDLFIRDHEMRPDFNIAIVKDGTPKQILQTQTHLERYPTIKVHESIHTAEDSLGSANTRISNLYGIINLLLNDKQSIVIPVLSIEGKKDAGKDSSHPESSVPETIIKVDGMSVFKKDKLVGWMDIETSIGLNYILDNIKSSLIHFNCDKDKIMTIEVVNNKTKTDVIIKDNEPSIIINVDTIANIGEVQCNINLHDQSVIEEISIKTENRIRQLMEKALIVGRHKYKSDIFGFSNLIYKKDYKLWYQIENKWEEMLGDIEIKTSINVNVKNKGNVISTLEE